MDSKSFSKDYVKSSADFVFLGGTQSNNPNDFTHILTEVSDLNSETILSQSQTASEVVQIEQNEQNEQFYPIDIGSGIINLKYFNFTKKLAQRDHFHKPTNILIIGKRATGKSWLIKDLTLKIILTEPTSEIVIFHHDPQVYANFAHPISNIITGLDSTHIDKILKKQSEPGAKPLIVIIDDAVHKIPSNKKSRLVEMILNARHYNIYVLIAIQFPIKLKAEIRINFDFVFVFKEEFISNAKRLHEHYFGFNPSFKQTLSLLKGISGDYGCLAIDNFSNTNNYEDKIQYYKVSSDIFNINPNNICIYSLDDIKYDNPNIEFDVQHIYSISKSKHKSYVKTIPNLDLNIESEPESEIEIKKKSIKKSTKEFESDKKDKNEINDDMYLSDDEKKKYSKEEILEKIKKNNILIKKLSKQNDKLFEKL